MPPTRLALLISLLQGAALLLPAQRVSNPSPPATTTGAPSDSAPSNSATPLPAQGIEFIAVVYDDKGAIVNSFVNTVPIDAGVADYSRIMQTGIGIQLPIAIPAKGDFYLRLGVHDLTSDRIGALEIPVEAIKLSPPQNSPATARQTR